MRRFRNRSATEPGRVRRLPGRTTPACTPNPRNWSDLTSPLTTARSSWWMPTGRAILVETRFGGTSEALQFMRRAYRTDLSPAVLKRAAAQMSVDGCTDPAFRTLRNTLRRWFPPEQP